MTVFADATGVAVAVRPALLPQAVTKNANTITAQIKRLIFFMIFLLAKQKKVAMLYY
jgi:hypothetical protein